MPVHAARDSSTVKTPGAYTLIVRGPDGQPRHERFADAASYRARLLALARSTETSISIDELAGLLDT